MKKDLAFAVVTFLVLLGMFFFATFSEKIYNNKIVQLIGLLISLVVFIVAIVHEAEAMPHSGKGFNAKKFICWLFFGIISLTMLLYLARFQNDIFF